MFRKDRDVAKCNCCSCPECLCVLRCKENVVQKLKGGADSATKAEFKKKGGGKQKKAKKFADKSTGEEASKASGYESIPDVCTEELELIEVPKKKSHKATKEAIGGGALAPSINRKLVVSRQSGLNPYENAMSLGALNDDNSREELRRKLEALDLKKKLENKWKEQRGERLKQETSSSVSGDDYEEDASDTGRFSRRKDRELMSVWSAFNLSNPANSQLRRSYPNPEKKPKDTDTVYEQVDPNSLKDPPSLESIMKEKATEESESESDALGTVAGEFYLGPVKIAEAQKVVTEIESFKFYHRLPTKDFENEDYSHIRDHLSLWIVYRNTGGRYRHYIVRQDRSSNATKWVVRNYSKWPKKFVHFQDLLKFYLENPQEIERAEE